MVLAVALAALFALFFLIRHHTGPAHLAMIAGLSVYEMFGKEVVAQIMKFTNQFPQSTVEAVVYLALVAGFPLLLYLRSKHGGLGGILRLAEAAIFAALMVSLVSTQLAQFFPFDSLSSQIASFITSIEGPIVAIGIVSAYIDILSVHG